jgi:hypothetical protein
MDTAWHSTTFGGYDEIPENQIPPAPTEAVVARVTAAAAQTPTRSSSQRRPAAARAVPASAAAAQQPQQREQKVRTLNVAMHGLEALTALHKVTQGKDCPPDIACTTPGCPFQSGCVWKPCALSQQKACARAAANEGPHGQLPQTVNQASKHAAIKIGYPSGCMSLNATTGPETCSHQDTQHW